jgi:hypothetical protein
MAGELWNEKNRTMRMFRQSQSGADLTSLETKMRDFKERRELMVKQRMNDYSLKGSARQAHIRSSVAAARNAADELAKQRSNVQAMKDKQTAAHYDALLKDKKDKEADGQCCTEAEERRMKAKELDGSFKEKAQAEIDKKESRYARDKAARNLTMIAKAHLHKEKKKQKTRPLSASNLSLLEHEYSTDGDEAPDDVYEELSSPASPSTVAGSRPIISTGSGVLPAIGKMPFGNSMSPTVTTPTFNETVLALSFRSGLSESTTQSIMAMMPSSARADNCLQALRDLEREVELQSSAREEAVSKNVQRPRSAESHGGDISGDEEFVKGLETRSAKWLTDLRQRMDT